MTFTLRGSLCQKVAKNFLVSPPLLDLGLGRPDFRSEMRDLRFDLGLERPDLEFHLGFQRFDLES